MGKPTSTPRWATAANPADIVEPNSGKKDVGWLANEAPPHGYFNWFWHLVYLWLAFLDLMFAFDGVRRVQSAESLAGVKAVVPDQDGEILVWQGVGLYYYAAASVLSGDDLNVVVPDSGTGRWIRHDVTLKGSANGVASLDSLAHVPVAQLPDGVAKISGAVNTGGGSPTVIGSAVGWSAAYVGSAPTRMVRITLSSARASANYAVLVTARSGAIFFSATPASTSQFDVAAYDAVSGQQDLGAVACPFSFTVIGG